MLLRSRNTNSSSNTAARPSEIPMPVKRHAAPNVEHKDQAKRKRTGLSDLSNAITNNLLINSSKKCAGKDGIKRRGAAVRAIGGSEAPPVSPTKTGSPKHKRLTTLRESSEKAEKSNDSVVVLDEQTDIEVDPCPEYDYDALNEKDPFAVATYARDIFKYYVFREKQFRVGDYLKRQPQITKEMRAVLADWMVEVQENFELNHETLYLAVKLTDMYLDKVSHVSRDDLQLIASTAIFISSKFDERSPPLIDDFLYICEDAYTRDALIKMEQKMLKAVKFDIGCPLSYRFLRRYAKVMNLDMATLTLARFVLETSLLFYEFIPVSESLMAAATLLLALRMKKVGDWNPILLKYSGYRLEQVEPLMWTLNHMMWKRSKVYDRLVTAFNKYSHEVFFEVAAVPLLEDRLANGDPIGPPGHLAFSS